jgi:uncharacterized protein (TIGR02145 family)
MHLLKAWFFGVAGASLCLANISGIVTDTGTMPIAGVVVSLEQGGQTTTTGTDGRFTLVTGTGIPTGNMKPFRNSLSAKISGNTMVVTIGERAQVEIATYDLSGKMLLTTLQTLNAGSHAVSLPQMRTGIYVYKVRSGSREYTLKGVAAGSRSSGNAILVPSSVPISLAKQLRKTGAINDVVAATKTGFLNYRCVQYISDTVGLKIKMIANAGDFTDVDGNVYQTVRIGEQVWMTENLRVTKYNDGSAIPLDTSTITWKNSTTPKYCFYNNTTNSETIKQNGALYNWYVVSSDNNKKIAPSGWHVPSNAEWDTLQNYLIANGYNWDGTTTGNKTAKALAAKKNWYANSTYGTIGSDLLKNNSSGFSALPGGLRTYAGIFFPQTQSAYGYWWSTTAYSVTYAGNRGLEYNSEGLGNYSNDKRCGFSVRLLRD